MSVFYQGYGAVLEQKDRRLAEAFGQVKPVNSNPGQVIDEVPAQWNGNPVTTWVTSNPARDTLIAERIIRSYERRALLFAGALADRYPLNAIRREAHSAGIPFATLMYDVPEHMARLCVYVNQDSLGGLLLLGDVEEHVIRAVLDFTGKDYLQAPPFHRHTSEAEARIIYFMELTGRHDGYEILRGGGTMGQMAALSSHRASAVRSSQAISEAVARSVPIAFAVAAFAAGADDVSIVVDAYESGVSLEILSAYFVADGAPG